MRRSSGHVMPAHPVRRQADPHVRQKGVPRYDANRRHDVADIERITSNRKGATHDNKSRAGPMLPMPYLALPGVRMPSASGTGRSGPSQRQTLPIWHAPPVGTPRPARPLTTVSVSVARLIPPGVPGARRRGGRRFFRKSPTCVTSAGAALGEAGCLHGRRREGKPPDERRSHRSIRRRADERVLLRR
jgi:hypothetical protein